MNRIKLFAVLIFSLFAITFYGYRSVTPTVIGQSEGVALSAPTGVIASDNQYSNKVGLSWDTVRGATLYRIFRNTTNNSTTATDVGTTAANFFFDPSAVTAQNYFYWVRAENSGTNSSLSVPDQGVRANGFIQPLPFPPLNPPPAPVGNEITATKIYLGKTLFWDEQLSSTRTVACGTCHIITTGGSDPRAISNPALSTNPGPDNTFNTADDIIGSAGVPLNNADGTYSLSPQFGFNLQTTNRKSPSFLNAGYSPLLFWDGRALGELRDPITNAVVLSSGAALESQVLGPPLNSTEMGHQGRDWNQAAAQISASKPLALAPSVPTALKTWIGGRNYPQLFQEAFGSPDVSPTKIALAIGTYERSLFSDQTPLDRQAYGIEELPESEDTGRQLFTTLQCAACHSGALLTDDQFHNIGVRPQSDDPGRFAITNNANDLGAVKTPQLRNLELRSPFMHNGKLQTIEEVVEFYNRGGDFDAPNIDRLKIRELSMSAQDKIDLAAFLKRPLTDPRVAAGTPPFDRPTLYAESNRVPQVIGTGRAGTGAIVPKVTAIEPPLLGNPSFTVGVSTALANSQAVLVIDSNDPGVGSTIPASGSFTRVTVTTSNGGAGSVSLQIPNNPALVGQTFFGRWYVTDAGAAGGFSVSRAFRFTVFSDAASGKKFIDFDGDGKSDISVYRPSGGSWFVNQSTNGFTGVNFGVSTDLTTPADFDGDGKTDVAVFRPSDGAWYYLRSSDGAFVGVTFGQNGDLPRPADFDGDGKADINVFRPSNGAWYRLNSSNGAFFAVQFGQNGDKPLIADFDGDNKSDIAVFRPSAGTFYSLDSSTGNFRGATFGATTDIPTPGDFDGDGKTDVAVFRPSNGAWYRLNSSNGAFFAVAFGQNGDIPVAADFDGDSKADVAVFRPSNGSWYYLNSTNGGFVGQSFGLGTDKPLQASFQ